MFWGCEQLRQGFSFSHDQNESGKLSKCARARNGPAKRTAEERSWVYLGTCHPDTSATTDSAGMAEYGARATAVADCSEPVGTYIRSPRYRSLMRYQQDIVASTDKAGYGHHPAYLDCYQLRAEGIFE